MLGFYLDYSCSEFDADSVWTIRHNLKQNFKLIKTFRNKVIQILCPSVTGYLVRTNRTGTV